MNNRFASGYFLYFVCHRYQLVTINSYNYYIGFPGGFFATLQGVYYKIIIG